MNSEKRKNRITEIQNRTKALKIRQQWIFEFSKLSGFQVSEQNFITIEKTASLKESVNGLLKKRGSTKKRFWAITERKELRSFLIDLCISYGMIEVILFSKVDSILGAINLPAHYVLRNFEDIWIFLQVDLCITTPDLHDGLCLEENYYDEDGEYHPDGVLELSTWGVFQGSSV
jgi:hypothetical protein